MDPEYEKPKNTWYSVNSYGDQVALGCLTWLGGLIAFVALCIWVPQQGAIVLVIGTELAIAWRFMRYNGWYGVLPGLFLGLVLTCLLPVAAINLLCGRMGH